LEGGLEHSCGKWQIKAHAGLLFKVCLLEIIRALPQLRLLVSGLSTDNDLIKMLDFFGEDMATLYVRNVPEDLYEALRRQARQNRSSIAAEVLALLEQHIPTARELRSRREFIRRLQLLRSTPSPSAGPFPSTEEMLREDRRR
jgi:plasmid stability protein